ncbi:hypothetical protein PQR72_05140 [Paraburkholderia madseniana]|uniref:hypothetical protein n=1 Tax=Paraburkholderia madseniana TaxID=2599607 RepID=UPI0015C5775D|nr:hypothetical protein [Paraburkholderia madseniana]NPT62947.1 hypothetical protein [Paraburkholderia madseniana]
MGPVCKEGTHPFLRDLPDGELHVLDTGHFALEYQLDVIGPLLLDSSIGRWPRFDADDRY